MYTYSIMPLREDHFEEICADVRDQYERDISTCPLFKMTLVPEGNPVWDKVSPMCALYRRYREALAPFGIKTGILIQASLGHSYELEPAPFDRYINLTDGKETFTYCPEDERFIDHFCGVLKQLAAEHPDTIMLDDDFRLVTRQGLGCACPRHMALFCERTKTKMTREELWEHIHTHQTNDPLSRAFLEIQQESLIRAASRFREAIDEIDPTIQGINCTSGDACESVVYTNKIFAGKGNPTIVRAANCSYAPLSVRRFSNLMRNAAVRTSKLKKHGIDIVLAETDTVPFNRYAKSARYMHAHYAASILEGMKGAKHWITRFTAYEPGSGTEFREILAQNAGLYRTLSELSDGLTRVGCGLYFLEAEFPPIHYENKSTYHENEWGASVFERMGLPFYYTDENRGVAFLESNIVKDMTDAEIKALFDGGSVFLSAEPATDLCERGFGELLGVRTEPWDGSRVSGESFDGTNNTYCTKQKNLVRLIPTNEKTQTLSQNFVTQGTSCTLLSPAVTCLERENGKLSTVYCGTPKAEFKYTEGFAFLNETRKTQFVELLKKANALPVYYPGDNELCLRAAYTKSGELLVYALILGFDPMDGLHLYLEKKPETIALLQSDGTKKELAFEALENSIYKINTRLESMMPCILLIQ